MSGTSEVARDARNERLAVPRAYGAIARKVNRARRPRRLRRVIAAAGAGSAIAAGRAARRVARPAARRRSRRRTSGSALRRSSAVLRMRVRADQAVGRCSDVETAHNSRAREQSPCRASARTRLPPRSDQVDCRLAAMLGAMRMTTRARSGPGSRPSDAGSRRRERSGAGGGPRRSRWDADDRPARGSSRCRHRSQARRRAAQAQALQRGDGGNQRQRLVIQRRTRCIRSALGDGRYRSFELAMN